ncbi:hypothetical protein YC2023_022815 [Brassica napus]
MCRHILRFKSLDSISGAPLASVNGIFGTANSICEKFRHKYMIDDKLLDLKYYHDPFQVMPEYFHNCMESLMFQLSRYLQSFAIPELVEVVNDRNVL